MYFIFLLLFSIFTIWESSSRGRDEHTRLATALIDFDLKLMKTYENAGLKKGKQAAE